MVPLDHLNWGPVEDITFSSYFTDWKTIRFAVIYIPFFAFIIFFLGLFGRLTRLSSFLFTSGFILLCCTISQGLPFYKFLYQHLFFLKYFRNLHFFLWFVLIPLFILLVLEHWKIFKNIKLKSFFSSLLFLIYIFVIHVLIFIVIYLRGDAINSTFAMLTLSAIFWILVFKGRLDNPAWVGFALLTITLVIQPLEVYHYLTAKVKPISNNMYGYHFPFTSLAMKTQEPSESLRGSSAKGGLYYASKNYNLLYQNISDYALAKYLQHKFIFVDLLEPMDPKNILFSNLEEYFLQNNNKAYVIQKGSAFLKLKSDDPNPTFKQIPVEIEDDYFKILSFNANYLKLFIKIPNEKFLIYNDSYDDGWKVFINGKPTDCYQTNVAFKGVWVPAGKNIIEFHFGSWWQYALNFVLLFGSFILLISIVWFSRYSSSVKGIDG